MDKETVLKPLERLITLLSNTEYESEVLEVKKEIESIWDEEEFQEFANNYDRDWFKLKTKQTIKANEQIIVY